ncbi:MAG: hypothetical protein ABS949_17445 [Solibacillus sp.]
MSNEYYDLYTTERTSLQQYSEQLTCKINNQAELLDLAQDIETLIERRDSLLALYKTLKEDGYKSNNKLPKTELAIEKLKNVNLTMYLNKTAAEEAGVYKQLQQLMKAFSKLVEAEQLEQKPVELYNKKSFLVETCTFMLRNLEKVSVFYILRKLLPKDYISGNTRFVDKWLIGHLFLALLYVFIAGSDKAPNWLKYTLLIYGCVRMFEVSIYQLNVILVHPYNTSNYSLDSYRRMTIALIHNFFEFIFWFAGTFVTMQFINGASTPLALYTSFVHMVTYNIDLDSSSKGSILAVVILQFQALIGVFMTMLSFARFISLFPQPGTQDKNEQVEDENYNKLMKVMEDNQAHILKTNEKIEQLTAEQRDLSERLDRQGVTQ